ncbi:MAG: DciA family protein [Candidatus Gygaella obscura]|nr:DciA family protein [Candidatus Gygaella obscura]
MEDIKQTLKKVFEKIEENQGGNKEARLKELLNKVLAEEEARQVKIKGVSKGKLYLGCGSSVLLYQVSLKKKELEKVILDEKESLKIKEIKITI